MNALIFILIFSLFQLNLSGMENQPQGQPQTGNPVVKTKNYELFSNLRRAWIAALTDKFAGSQNLANRATAQAAIMQARDLAQTNMDLNLEIPVFEAWLEILYQRFQTIENNTIVVPELKIGDDLIAGEEKINAKDAFELAAKLGENAKQFNTGLLLSLLGSMNNQTGDGETNP